MTRNLSPVARVGAMIAEMPTQPHKCSHSGGSILSDNLAQCFECGAGIALECCIFKDGRKFHWPSGPIADRTQDGHPANLGWAEIAPFVWQEPLR